MGRVVKTEASQISFIFESGEFILCLGFLSCPGLNNPPTCATQSFLNIDLGVCWMNCPGVDDVICSPQDHWMTFRAELLVLFSQKGIWLS